MKVAITPTSKLAINSFVSMGMPSVDGIPRSSPYSSIAYHPATTKRSQFAVVPAAFGCGAEPTSFRCDLDPWPSSGRRIASGRMFRAGQLPQPEGGRQRSGCDFGLKPGRKKIPSKNSADGRRRRSQNTPQGSQLFRSLAMSTMPRLSTDCLLPPINFRKQLSTCISPNGL
jgi:hypothetical protein